ncbi:SAM-dependent RNA methyltransferase [Catenaria anguillulae PL171]|uniref:SAM-dependent RNA methyltransferase n=1 Tax=Catenaria anguillulae PL171 TaxID=765915 RepID=A0A1Y2H8A4_9FUNG|nr:SAM-dependent RNA methyltransferase [Catenaria anguillulae PL171]
MKYIVEHLEEDLHEWCRLEYSHMLDHVGRAEPANLIFTNMHAPIVASLTADTGKHPHLERLRGCLPTSKDVTELGIPFDRICLLDMEATQELSPEDADKFDYMLFGGILGDGYESADRTSILRKLGFPSRRLGPIQMTTDTAVITTHLILEKKQPLDTIEFCDLPEIKFSKHESVELPYRYIGKRNAKTGKLEPMMAPGMFEKLKRDNEEDLFNLNMN